MGIAMGSGAALLPKIMDDLGAEEQGVGFGLGRTTYMILGSLGSVGVGLIAERFDWGVAFLTLAGLLGLVLFVLIWLTVAEYADGRSFPPSYRS
jgi:cyanate permease